MNLNTTVFRLKKYKFYITSTPKYFMNFYYLQRKTTLLRMSLRPSMIWCQPASLASSTTFFPADLTEILYRHLSTRFTWFYQSEMLFYPCCLPTCYLPFKAWLKGQLQIRLIPQMLQLNLTALFLSLHTPNI